MAKGDAQRAARKAGKDFEKEIAHAIRAATLEGLVLYSVHAEPVFRRFPGGFMPVAQGGADYSGYLSNGLAFAIEAKTTKAPRYLKRQLHEKQVEQLSLLDRAGGLALLAMEFRSDGLMVLPRRFLAPWHAIPWSAARSSPGVSADDLTGWELPRRGALERFMHRCLLCQLLFRSDMIHDCPKDHIPF